VDSRIRRARQRQNLSDTTRKSRELRKRSACGSAIAESAGSNSVRDVDAHPPNYPPKRGNQSPSAKSTELQQSLKAEVTQLTAEGAKATGRSQRGGGHQNFSRPGHLRKLARIAKRRSGGRGKRSHRSGRQSEKTALRNMRMRTRMRTGTIQK